VKLKVVSQRNFLWNSFWSFFFNAYYVCVAVIARWPASGISLTIKTFEIWHKFHRNVIRTHATQKSLDYFVIRFLSFYQINTNKVENIVCILHSFYKTHCVTRFFGALTAFVVPQPNRVTIKRLMTRIKLFYYLNEPIFE
jgi:hypothetical protein